MNITLIIRIFCVLFFAAAQGMQRTRVDAQVSYKEAQLHDIPALLQCLQEIEKTPDAENLVILPKKFREGALANAIEHKRLFIAYKEGKLVGFKKLYRVPAEELHELLQDEIRCIDRVSADGDPAHTIDNTAYYIYTGADYTHADYRGQGINNALYAYALSQQDIIPGQKCIFVFGVTEDNAGESLLAAGCRPATIKKMVEAFFERTRAHVPDFSVTRYHAVKPTFVADAQECRPLPDEYGVKGYGYVMQEKS